MAGPSRVTLNLSGDEAHGLLTLIRRARHMGPIVKTISSTGPEKRRLVTRFRLDTVARGLAAVERKLRDAGVQP